MGNVDDVQKTKNMANGNLQMEKWKEKEMTKIVKQIKVENNNRVHCKAPFSIKV